MITDCPERGVMGEHPLNRQTVKALLKGTVRHELTRGDSPTICMTRKGSGVQVPYGPPRTCRSQRCGRGSGRRRSPEVGQRVSQRMPEPPGPGPCGGDLLTAWPACPEGQRRASACGAGAG